MTQSREAENTAKKERKKEMKSNNSLKRSQTEEEEQGKNLDDDCEEAVKEEISPGKEPEREELFPRRPTSVSQWNVNI